MHIDSHDFIIGSHLTKHNKTPNRFSSKCSKDLGDGKGLAIAQSVEVMSCAATAATLRLVVSSGRYHLVRRMLAAVGLGAQLTCRRNMKSTYIYIYIYST